MTGVLIRRGNVDSQRYTRDGCAQRTDRGGHREKVAVCKPSRKALGENKPADPLILDFQAPELRGDKFVLFKPPSMRGFVITALVN